MTDHVYNFYLRFRKLFSSAKGFRDQTKLGNNTSLGALWGLTVLHLSTDLGAPYGRECI
jgi:hypothetical protein